MNIPFSPLKVTTAVTWTQIAEDGRNKVNVRRTQATCSSNVESHATFVNVQPVVPHLQPNVQLHPDPPLIGPTHPSLTQMTSPLHPYPPKSCHPLPSTEDGEGDFEKRWRHWQSKRKEEIKFHYNNECIFWEEIVSFAYCILTYFNNFKF